MKLYDIPKGSKIKGLKVNGKDEIIIFHKIDGMFSYCTIEGKEDIGPVHLGAAMPLKKEGNYYVIA